MFFNRVNRNFRSIVLALFSFLIFSSAVSAQVVNFSGTEMLFRPTDHSITISVIPDEVVEYYFDYRKEEEGSYSGRWPVTGYLASVSGEPVVEVLDGLSASTKYYYRMVYKVNAGADNYRDEHFFHTARIPGETFTFAVQSDMHFLSIMCRIPDIALTNVLIDEPDFLIDLGDNSIADGFMASSTNASETEGLIFNLRDVYDEYFHSIPVFLSLGNHEGEDGFFITSSSSKWWNSVTDNMAVTATNARKKYFPNPYPDDFYTGDETDYTTIIGGDGRRESYFAWEWGNALFVVLDNYWYTPTEWDMAKLWARTLGIEQHLWLKETLENSTVTFKFVFMHHQLGSTILNERGGIEQAGYGEMGGKNSDGTDGWAANRPSVDGWYKPLHDMMVENNVTIFFHGHDHAWVTQKLDGVIYQELPFAANPNAAGFVSTYTNYEAKISSGGFARVTVSKADVSVEYVRASDDANNGQVSYRYTISAADFDHDGKVGLTDLAYFIGCWLESGCPDCYCFPCNLQNSDTIIDLSDFAVFAESWKP